MLLSVVGVLFVFKAVLAPVSVPLAKRLAVVGAATVCFAADKMIQRL